MRSRIFSISWIGLRIIVTWLTKPIRVNIGKSNQNNQSYNQTKTNTMKISNFLILSFVAAVTGNDMPNEQGMRGLQPPENKGKNKAKKKGNKLLSFDLNDGKVKVEIVEHEEAGIVSVKAKGNGSPEDLGDNDPGKFESASAAYKGLTGKDAPGLLVAAEKRASHVKPPKGGGRQLGHNCDEPQCDTCTEQVTACDGCYYTAEEWEDWCWISGYDTLDSCSCLHCVKECQQDQFVSHDMYTWIKVEEGAGTLYSYWRYPDSDCWHLYDEDWITADDYNCDSEWKYDFDCYGWEVHKDYYYHEDWGWMSEFVPYYYDTKFNWLSMGVSDYNYHADNLYCTPIE